MSVDYDITTRIRRDIVQAGLTPSREFIADGKIHCFGKKKSCWYILHNNGHSYVYEFGDWSTGLSVKGHYKTKPLTHAEVEASKENLSRDRINQEAEKEKARDLAGAEVLSIWRKAAPALPSHPYLVRKQIKPHNIRQLGEKPIIPVRKNNQLISIQYINGHGIKYFHKGSSYQGSCNVIGSLEGARVIAISEGFATAASIHEAAGYPVVIAFSAGNLRNVAGNVFSWFKHSSNNQGCLVICGDDDAGNATNVGRKKALEAAEAIGAKAVFPIFADRRLQGGDFNNLHQLEGLEAVARCIYSQLNTSLSGRQDGGNQL